MKRTNVDVDERIYSKLPINNSNKHNPFLKQERRNKPSPVTNRVAPSRSPISHQRIVPPRRVNNNNTASINISPLRQHSSLNKSLQHFNLNDQLEPNSLSENSDIEVISNNNYNSINNNNQKYTNSNFKTDENYQTSTGEPLVLYETYTRMKSRYASQTASLSNQLDNLIEQVDHLSHLNEDLDAQNKDLHAQYDNQLAHIQKLNTIIQEERVKSREANERLESEKERMEGLKMDIFSLKDSAYHYQIENRKLEADHKSILKLYQGLKTRNELLENRDLLVDRSVRDTVKSVLRACEQGGDALKKLNEAQALLDASKVNLYDAVGRMADAQNPPRI